MRARMNTISSNSLLVVHGRGFALPHRVTDYHHQVRRGALVIGMKGTPEDRLHPEHVKGIRAHERGVPADRPHVSTAQCDVLGGEPRHPLKARLLCAPISEVVMTHLHAPPAARLVGAEQLKNPVGLIDRQVPQHPVYDREHDGGHPRTERERENRDRRHAATSYS